MESILQGTNGSTVEGSPTAAETLKINKGTGAHFNYGPAAGIVDPYTTSAVGHFPANGSSAVPTNTTVRACNFDQLWPAVRRDYFPGYWGAVNYSYSLAAPNKFEQAFKVAGMLLKEGIIAELAVPAFVDLVKKIEGTL